MHVVVFKNSVSRIAKFLKITQYIRAIFYAADTWRNINILNTGFIFIEWCENKISRVVNITIFIQCTTTEKNLNFLFIIYLLSFEIEIRILNIISISQFIYKYIIKKVYYFCRTLL